MVYPSGQGYSTSLIRTRAQKSKEPLRQTIEDGLSLKVIKAVQFKQLFRKKHSLPNKYEVV